MELELGLSLSLPHQYHPISGMLDLKYGPAKCKPLYPITASCEEPRDPNYLTTLPLFCTHHSGDDDDDEAEDQSKSLCQMKATIFPSQDSEKNVMGWPPVKSWRINHLGGRDSTQEVNVAANYVKVKMDGMAIGRKVDLAQHRSYQTLISALTAMFGIRKSSSSCMPCTEDDGAAGIHSSYSFSYQDQQGRWLILGDVSWGVFVHSVQRLAIRRNVRPNYVGI